ncbi:MAG TPA: efflux RND transporter permease subunit [Gemmataceae bacterium]|nr:efflux RND transporter permease subunit [Gemmataceae bacterium]
MIPRFFIDRPIFATALSVIITLAGALAVSSLPVSQYPKVTPPTIQVDCNYPGASAEVVSKTIAAPVEQQVNGVEDMMYMSSQCTSDGSYTLTVTFKTGTDLNMAHVRVLNRVALAMPQLPDVVRATSVTTRKRSPELLLTVALSSPDGRYDQLYLSNYAVLRLKDELSRLPGISDVTVFGQRDYAIRIWVDPEKLAARSLSSADVVRAIREQNAQVAAGQIGQPPIGSGQPIQVPLDTLGRLSTVEEFEQVVVKVGSEGQLVQIKDVARVELGAKSHDVSNRFDTKPTIGLAIFLLSDANALEVADTVKAKMDALSKDFPPGMMHEIGYDTSPFIRESINEVFKSLRDSIILVAIVVLIFLQSWRAAVIPLAAVPVAIVGTFGAMYVAGFTLNNLTLFGLVLAVGIVVDDAIVVVEAVQHNIEKGYAPREATIRAMNDVAGPVIAVGVVLAAVFFPCSFLSGLVGLFFRQFALTIAVSTLISMFNSLTLSPALCALLLKEKKPQEQRTGVLGRIASVFRFPFDLFNRAFAFSGRVYVRSVGFALRVPVLVLAGYAGLVAAGLFGYGQLPTGFIPQQDKGYLIASVQLPDAASAERTQEVIQKIARLALDLEMDDGRGNKTHPVKHCNAVAGNSFALSAYGSNFGSMFIILDGFENRRAPNLYADKVMAALRKKYEQEVPEAQVNVFGAPAVSGLGRAGGFRIMIEDRGDVGAKTLQEQTDALITAANRRPEMVGLFTVFKTNSPQVFLEEDPAACMAHGVEVGELRATLQSSMGSRYVNDLNLFGRTWQVNVQADDRFRDEMDDIRRLKVRNRHGQMVPIGAVVRPREVSGPLVITRYNMYPAAAVNGNIAPATSTGDAIAAMERLAESELPQQTMGYEWTELMYLEQQSRDTGLYIFAVSLAFVFLVLAALYESWAFPLAVILAVPVCVACSLAAVWLTDPGSAAQSLANWNASPDVAGWLKPGSWAMRAADWLDARGIGGAKGLLSAAGVRNQDVNVFTQVGFVVLIGLACKNAILIVEFAKVARDRGADLRTAVLDACRLRYRPIIMTSAAFILGVLPLAVARGAGSEMRQALGVAVLGGMIGVTVFGIVLTPIFFAVVDRLAGGRAFRHPWVVAASDGLMYVLRFRFVRPLAGAMIAAGGAGLRKVTRRRFGA